MKNDTELLKESYDKAKKFYDNMSFETKWDFQCAFVNSSITMEDFNILVTDCFQQGYIEGYKNKI